MDQSTNISGIRLTDRERASLAKAMGIHTGQERRRHRRFMLPKEFALVVRCAQPGGGGGTFSVTPRDISLSGIGFFHAAYIHPGTACTLIMRTLKGDAVSLAGTVMRCRHVSGRIHEVGVVFEHEVDVESFVADAKPVDGELGAVKPEDVMIRISHLAAELKMLADQHASASSLLSKVGELAMLVAPFDPQPIAAAPPPVAPAASGPNPGATDAAPAVKGEEKPAA
jgi:hypothetical protein